MKEAFEVGQGPTQGCRADDRDDGDSEMNMKPMHCSHLYRAGSMVQTDFNMWI
jgi:hypothetical protein